MTIVAVRPDSVNEPRYTSLVAADGWWAIWCNEIDVDDYFRRRVAAFALDSDGIPVALVTGEDGRLEQPRSFRLARSAYVLMSIEHESEATICGCVEPPADGGFCPSCAGIHQFDAA